VTGEFDRSKSLQELEQWDWGEPTYNSHLVRTIHRLRRKPLAEFDVEDLRIVIRQGIGLPFLIPLAMERLEEDPLAGGDFFDGDLLQAVLEGGEAFWGNRSDLVQRLRKVIQRAIDLLPSLPFEGQRDTVLEMLAEAPRSLTD
jgi:hypothetical protein